MSWNVNSVRARLDHVLTFLAEREPDIACLQETKVEDALFPRVPFMDLGYQVNLHGSKGMAGVATLTKMAATSVQTGFLDGPPDKHARILAVNTGDVRVYNLYVPNGTEVGSAAYRYKLRWLERLRGEFDAHRHADQPIVVVGDFNVAPQPRDVWDPPRFEGALLYTDEERAALEHFVAFGLVDCFRLREEGGGHFTWFDYRTNGFDRNEGVRIDHVYATEVLASRCQGVEHVLEPRAWDKPSDHTPVLARFGG